MKTRKYETRKYIPVISEWVEKSWLWNIHQSIILVHHSISWNNVQTVIKRGLSHSHGLPFLLQLTNVFNTTNHKFEHVKMIGNILKSNLNRYSHQLTTLYILITYS